MSLAGLPVELGRSEWPVQAGRQWAVLPEAVWAGPCLPGGPRAFPGLSSVQPVSYRHGAAGSVLVDFSSLAPVHVWTRAT